MNAFKRKTRERKLALNGYEVELSSTEKVLFPDAGLTKGDLIDYYRRIAPIMLPHVVGRPISLERYPDGIASGGFFQKNAPDYFPSWIERAELAKEDGTVDYVVARQAATLVYLANQGSITLHVGLSRTDRIDRPDRLVIDLDPPGHDFGKVKRAARWVRDLLDELQLAAFVQSTGSRGLHVWTPLDRSADFDAVREFAKDLADRLARCHPVALTTEQRKAARGERVYLDVMRNAYGQTAVAPYSVRARPGAPVATPLNWAELDDPNLSPTRYTVRTLFRRLGQKADPWADIDRQARPIDQAAARLNRLAP